MYSILWIYNTPTVDRKTSLTLKGLSIMSIKEKFLGIHIHKYDDKSNVMGTLGFPITVNMSKGWVIPNTDPYMPEHTIAANNIV